MDRRPGEGSDAAMPKQYRDAHSTTDQVLLLPPSLHDWLPADHAAYFVLDVIGQWLDGLQSKEEAEGG